ncbi:MAG TPA: CbiX/SirB N-terminal domain-containing protein [Syntrophomonadaceae bacterium]|nr:CbiX/SirB N-terminal domain-containing protein [Syntrophomonadaceae bacterium]
MREGVVLLAHGSKRQEANQEIGSLLSDIQNRDPEGIYELALMSFGPPGIPDAIGRLAARGVERIVVMPLFLVTGNHIHHDIPDLLLHEKARYPEVEFVMARHLAGHPGLINIVLDRILESSNGKRVQQ